MRKKFILICALSFLLIGGGTVLAAREIQNNKISPIESATPAERITAIENTLASPKISVAEETASYESSLEIVEAVPAIEEIPVYEASPEIIEEESISSVACAWNCDGLCDGSGYNCNANNGGYVDSDSNGYCNNAGGRGAGCGGRR